ncbi:protein of unknown function [Paraburkholderia kururiensis]
MKATDGPVLILQDTTAFSYQRERPELIGYTGKTTLRTGKNGMGPRRPLTQCGILIASVEIPGKPRRKRPCGSLNRS